MTLIKFRNDRVNTPRVFNDWMEDFFTRDVPSLFNPMSTSMPAVNVAENADGYRLEVALPGWNENQININLEGNLLSISGKQEEASGDSGDQYTRREFRSSSFSRTFTLPETVNAEGIAADFQNGVLTVSVPKLEKAKDKGPKTIQIGSNRNSKTEIGGSQTGSQPTGKKENNPSNERK